jgi:hypothetical protein
MGKQAFISYMQIINIFELLDELLIVQNNTDP